MNIKKYFKFDKEVFMNFIHSFLGGISGGIVVIYLFDDNPLNFPSISKFIGLFILILIVMFVGIFAMAFINNHYDKK